MSNRHGLGPTLPTLLLLVVISSHSTAQFEYGELVFCNENTSIDNSGRILRLTAANKILTVTQTLFPAYALVPSPTNRGLWVAGIRWYWQQLRDDGVILEVAKDGSVTSLLFTRSLYPASLSMHDDGTVIITDRMSGAVVRYDPLQSSMTTLYPRWISSSGAAIDLATGDLIMASTVGLHRLTLTGPRSITTISLHTIPAGHYGMHTDPVTGDMLVAERANLWSVRLTTPPKNTLITSGYPFIVLGVVQRDPDDGRYLVPSWATAQSHIFRIDTTTKGRWEVARHRNRCMALTKAGSRHLSTGSVPTRGGQLPMLISFPLHPGAIYVVALSFDHKPGFAVGNGFRVQLAQDALFRVSLVRSPLFAGFQGNLDPRGEGRANLFIPNDPALAGRRIFAAAVAVGKKGVVGVSNPIGFTIR